MDKLTSKKSITTNLIFFFLSTLNLFAQQNYLPATIINANNETIEGFINYRNWEKNPDKISFKTNLAAKAKDYSPIDIKEFKVKDEVYVSAIVNSKISTDQVSKIVVDQKIKLQTDTTFLQTIVEGNKSLYYFKNNNNINNFYINEGGKFQLLVYWKYQKNEGNSTALAENKKYIGQLILYLDNCKSIKSKINNTKYTLASLKKLFENYYACTSSDLTFQKQKDKPSFNMGLFGGVSITKLLFESTYPTFQRFSNASFNPSIGVSAGLYVNYTLPRSLKKWSISTDLLYTSSNQTGNYQNYTNENEFINHETQLKLQYLKLFNAVSYKFLSRDFDLYLKIGLSNGFALNLEDIAVQERKFYSLEENTNFENPLEYRKYEQGIVASIGGAFNEYQFEIRYERGNGFFNYNVVNSNSNRVYFLLYYSLFQKN